MKKRIKTTLQFTGLLLFTVVVFCGVTYFLFFNAAVVDDATQRINFKKFYFFSGIVIVLYTLVIFISVYYFSKILLRPIKNIADEVNSISAQNINYRLQPDNNIAELNYLTETLNDLLNRLQESFEIQRRFISVASHELLTPLTSISSQLEVSLLKDRNALDYQQVMQSVYQDVRQLSKLTQTLLEFAAVSGSAGGIELKQVRIDEVLMRLPGEIIKEDKDFFIKFEFDDLPEDESRLFVYGNAELLFTAIRNIVLNACKYSSSKFARVKLSVAEQIIIIAVEDDGKGIPENEIKNIFQPFYRVESNASISGFGVGLPLVKRIIKLHNGQIRVSSVIDKGTSFFIELPCAAKFSL